VRPGTERRFYFEEKPRPDLEVVDTDARAGSDRRGPHVGFCLSGFLRFLLRTARR